MKFAPTFSDLCQHPFGMLIKDRTYTSDTYRFGFNNQEKDDEINGTGNSYVFEYRIHDPRLGRFLSVDPLVKEYPWNSPYAFAENRIIDGMELEGLEYVSVNNSGVNPEVHKNSDNTYTFSLGNLLFENIEKVNIGGEDYFDLKKHVYYGDNGWSNSGTRAEQMTDETKAGIKTLEILSLPRKPSNIESPPTYVDPQKSWDLANTYENPGGMCYAICMARYNQAFGETVLEENDKSLDYKLSGTINRKINVGYGVGGALANNGDAVKFNTDDLWNGKAQIGAAIQWWWGAKSQTELELANNKSVIGHSLIFHSYIYDKEGNVTGFNFIDDYGLNGLPTPNVPIMKDSDWIFGGYNYGRIGDHLILGANLKD